MIRYTLPIIIGLTLLSLSNIALAEWQLIGKSQMRWFSLKLYDIALYSNDGLYKNDQPLALSITYKRNFSNKQLISSSKKEATRLGLRWEENWNTRLYEIWPSVNRGDTLRLQVNIQGISSFYLNKKLIGKISHPEFGSTFLSIWLSPKTRKPKIRRQLIGLD